MSAYDKARSQATAGDEHFKTTTARIRKIQAQLANTSRGTKLQGKICVITGVSSMKGIGRATSILFAHEGLRSDSYVKRCATLDTKPGAKHLYLIDYSSENLPNLKTTIEKAYPDVKVTTIHADASDEAAISGVCTEALREEGQLDVFFANAGVASKDDLANTTTETFMNTMRVNALSCFLAVKYASAAMQKVNPSGGKEFSGGSIIMTASTAGIRSGAGPVDYSASKAAVNSMAKTSAYQLQKRDIRVNSICPGLIETGMTDGTFEYARQRGTAAKIGQLNPLGRFGVAEEIASVAAFLASDDSSYVNGQNIAVDGGLSASHPVVPGRWA